jgi:catechol-2,3-dioxygenase
MIKGLSGATIWTEDLSNLLPFYRDVLGLAVGSQTPGFVVLGEPGRPTARDLEGSRGQPAPAPAVRPHELTPGLAMPGHEDLRL